MGHSDFQGVTHLLYTVVPTGVLKCYFTYFDFLVLE